MKHQKISAALNLFPFLTILLATMGILAFISLCLLFSTPEGEYHVAQTRGENTPGEGDTVMVEFKMIGKPDFIYPHYVICKKNELILQDNKTVVPWNEEVGIILYLSYLYNLQDINNQHHQKFQDHQEYIIFVVYPGGILTYFQARHFLQKITTLNFGVEPMLANWKVVD